MNIPAKNIRRPLSLPKRVSLPRRGWFDRLTNRFPLRSPSLPKRTYKVVIQMRTRRIELVMNGSPPERRGYRATPIATPAAKGTLIPTISLASFITQFLNMR